MRNQSQHVSWMQKLELFSEHKSPNLRQILARLAYKPSTIVDLLVGMTLMQLFQQIRGLAVFKSFSFDAFETFPV